MTLHAIRIGEKIEFLPQDYYTMLEALPSNGVVVMASEYAQEGVYAFVKRGVLVKIIRKENLLRDVPGAGEADAVVAHTKDIDGPLREWMNAAKRQQN